MSMTPEQFAAHWADMHLKETASYVTHFDDLCELLGHAKPAHMDKTGETFTYQKGVIKGSPLTPALSPAEGGGDAPAGRRPGEGVRGFADVWYRGHFAWEYKGAGKHKDLRAAFQQLLLYKDALENPPLLVVSDIERYEIHTNFTNAISVTYAFTHADLARPTPVAGSRFTALQLLDRLFRDPEALRPEKTVERVTREAADQFAQLADSMHKHKVAPLHAARFLVKLVFCLFCEDVGLLPKDLFTKIVAATKDHPREFVRHMQELFGAMAVGSRIVWGEPIAHFDGGLFTATEKDADVVEFDGADLRVLEKAATLNWADVDPSIFGTLFERALDVEGKRAQMGAHYTPRSDIITVVEPVLMAPLRREWKDVKSRTADYLDWQEAKDEGRRTRDEGRRKKEALAKDEGRRMRDEGNRKKEALENLLRDFQDKLAALKILDPACGSGNFLYVSLALLKDLEKEIITFALSVGLPDFEPRVNPVQLYGIEKDDYAFQLASIVVWIGYLQWKVKNGYAPAGETPILKPLDTIRQMDAILDPLPASPISKTEMGEEHSLPATATSKTEMGKEHSLPIGAFHDGEGRGGVEPAWPPADVIVGNPPFLGGNKIRAELGDEYVDALFKLYEGRVPAFSDLCCYWFEKARAMIEAGKAKRVGLLATNSIRGGVNREVLKRIKQTGDIFWAESDRDWVLDGAAVRVSMAGFDNGSQKARILDSRVVGTINADLTATADLTQARPLKENQGVGFRGNQKGGPFDITAEQARSMLSAPINPNGRANSDVVRSWVNGLDITRQPRHMWIIDFGTNMPREEASLYEMPFEYVKTHVYPERKNNPRKAYKDRWWIHMEARPSMRAAIAPLKRYIVTPHVSKYRLFVWLEGNVIPDHQLIVFARDDDYTFGVLHSKVHELWALRMGTSLEDRPRYTPSTTFETFPFPRPTPAQKKAVALAAKELNEKRESWLNPYKDDPATGSPATGSGLPAVREELKKRTLTNLYNQMPEWLRLAHEKLDRAVLDAYGWPHAISDDEILARLLEENLKREAASTDRTDKPDEDEADEKPKRGKAKGKVKKK